MEPDRRRHTRVSLKGTTILRQGSSLLRGRISNLSLGGLAAITRTTAPERLLGSRVELVLRLDAGDSRWLACRGQLLRIEAASLAMSLEVVPPEFARVLDDMQAASDRNDRLITVVVVDASPDHRAELALAFRTAGCNVIATATPLEAIVRLGEAEFEPHLITVADTLPSSVAEELRRFVESEHPRTMLVAVGPAPDAPQGTLHWLSSSDLANDLDARVHAVLSQLARR